MQPDQQQRIMGYFIEEAKDHLNTIEQGLLNLQSTIEDPEMVNEVFRAAHSVKGGAAMLGLNGIQRVSHRLEDCFKVLKETPIRVDQKLENLFLKAFDALQELLSQLQGPFGLTEDAANQIVAGVEPTFEELDQHLNQLAGVTGTAPQPEIVIAGGLDADIPATGRLEESLEHLFRNDVPLRLREMLQLFKQPETDLAARQQLQELCRSLSSLGEQYQLHTWCHLVETARRAIAHTENSYRILAPIVIKDIKLAQEFILAGRSLEIAPCTQLRDLVPTPVVQPEMSSGDDFADLLEVTGTDALTDDALALAFDDLAVASSEINLSSDLSNDLIEAEAGIRQGPEVGMAELNSLADLFEGEMPELGLTWQQEEVVTEEDELLTTEAGLNSADDSSDFSDLLFEEAEFHPNPSSTSDDLSDLFGDDLDDIPTQVTLNPSSMETNASANSEADDFADLLGIASSSESLDLDFNLDTSGDLFQGDLASFDFNSPVSNEASDDSLSLDPVSDLDLEGAFGDLGDLFDGLNESDLPTSPPSQEKLSSTTEVTSLESSLETSNEDHFGLDESESLLITESDPSMADFEDNTALPDLDEFDLFATNAIDTPSSEEALNTNDSDESLDALLNFNEDFSLDSPDEVIDLDSTPLDELNTTESVEEPSFDLFETANTQGSELDLLGETSDSIIVTDDLGLNLFDELESSNSEPPQELDLDLFNDLSGVEIAPDQSLDLFDEIDQDRTASESVVDDLGLDLLDSLNDAGSTQSDLDLLSSLEAPDSAQSVEFGLLDNLTDTEAVEDSSLNQAIPEFEPSSNTETDSIPDPWNEDLFGSTQANSFSEEPNLPETELSMSDLNLDDLNLDDSFNLSSESSQSEDSYDSESSILSTSGVISDDEITNPVLNENNLFDQENSSDFSETWLQPTEEAEFDLSLGLFDENTFQETTDELELESLSFDGSNESAETDLTDSELSSLNDLLDLDDSTAEFSEFVIAEEPTDATVIDIDSSLSAIETNLTDTQEFGELEPANSLEDLDDLLDAAAMPEQANESGSLDDLLNDSTPLESVGELGDLDDLLNVNPAPEPADALSHLDELLDDTAWGNGIDAEFASDSELNDLENLLSEDTLDTIGDFDITTNDSLAAESVMEPQSLGINGFTDRQTSNQQSDDFSDLESLLANDPLDDATNLTIPNSGIDESEFDDLNDLLKDAEEKMGGTPTVKVGAGLSANRRTSRPGRVFSEQTMRVPVKHLDNLSNLVGELVVNRNSLEQDQERLRQSLDNLLYQVQQLSDVGQRMQDLYERSLLESSLLASRQGYHHSPLHVRSGDTTIMEAVTDHHSGVEYDPLEMDRFTGFHSLSQEMIELIVRVRESSSDIEFIVDETEQVTRMFRQVTTQLQEGLTRSRMVPFAQTADRLPRAVREISQKVGKQAELVIEGRETLIDKMILEQLYDPMTHLVNNAITHGIESPSVRLAAGKPAVGRITIRAFHQGNQTIISVADDGAGIDVERVKAKAIEKGMITQADARSFSRLDMYDLLFHPGFSTKDQADDFSGRGVGMDVVRTSLSEIRGVINTDSNPGKGTSFTIRLPLTLSISKALCCISDRARIAFPMDGVEDMLDVPKERIQTNAENQPCIAWRDTVLTVRPLADLLGYNRHLSRGNVYGGNQEDDMVSIVVLRSAGNFLALQVDQVMGEQEIVIKQLEGPVPKPVGVAGATVLGDGRIMPIADVLELIDLSMGRIRRDAGGSLWEQDGVAAIPDTPAAKTEPMVLIVDDSITVRELLSMTFNKVGYRVEQARDGQEAWEKLRSGLPCDIVFCDIEMPRMDGLELLSRIQKDANLKHLPIAMLTSRGADRHRQMAASLGASGYFTKPYLEEALLDAAQRMLKGERLLSNA